MIFITVGTHEQQFNRLIKKIDDLVGAGIVKEEVFIQKGFSDYIPKNCDWVDFLSYEEMENFISRSSCVITHGGPSTYMNVISKNKNPIIVPRLKKYNEHVNDHQLDFLKKLKLSGTYHLIFIEEVSELERNINQQLKNKKISEFSPSTNNSFVSNLKNVIDDLFKEKV
ncbi:glycosyltransferase [Streptococcus hongkongensis]|nr:multidrug MFS transporter [Streptococcus uberis]